MNVTPDVGSGSDDHPDRPDGFFDQRQEIPYRCCDSFMEIDRKLPDTLKGNDYRSDQALFGNIQSRIYKGLFIDFLQSVECEQ